MKFYLCVFFIALTIAPACRNRKSANLNDSEISDTKTPEPQNKKIVWIVKWKNEFKKINIGLEQPDGGISYDPKGMQDLAGVCEEILLSATVEESFLQALERRSTSVGFDAPQVARNALPKELIPAALWNKGVRWDFFIWPMDELSPDQMEKAYLKLAVADRAKIRKSNPLLGSDEITFQKMMILYRQVYDLEVFRMIRHQIEIENGYKQASIQLKSSIQQTENIATFFAVSPVFAFWDKVILGPGRIRSLGRLTASVVSLLPIEFVRSRIESSIKSSIREDAEYQRLTRELRAIRMEGLVKGPEYLKNNLATLEWFKSGEGAKIVPNFARFLTDQRVAEFLLDPVNCYELEHLMEITKKIDTSVLADLNLSPNTIAAAKLAEKISEGLGDAGLLEAQKCTSKERAESINKRAKNEIAAFILNGSQSALFNETLLLSLASSPNRKIQLAKLPMKTGAISIAGVTSNRGPIKIISGSMPWEVSTRDAFTYLLAHELWHALTKHWIFNQLFHFSGQREFFSAISGDETVAVLLSLAVRDQIKRDRNGFLDGVKNIADTANVFSGFVRMANMDPQEIRSGPMYDIVSKSQIKAFKGWRGDTIPEVTLPHPLGEKSVPWYVRWYLHLSSYFPTNAESPFNPCAAYLD